MNAIILDFDGTIADSFDVVLEFLLPKVGRRSSDLTPEERQQLRGLSMRELATHVGVPRWRLPLLYFQGKATLTRHMHRVPVFPGMEELIAALKRENYDLYIMSSNSTRNINRFLTERGLGNYFTKIYGNVGWLGKGGALKRLLRQNQLQAAKTVYVGDEVRDIVGANLAGMPSVAVNWGFGSSEQLLAHKPTILVRSTADLQKTLIDWGSTL